MNIGANPSEAMRTWRRLAFWAFALNTIWEFAQCPIFYNMSQLPPAISVLWIIGAIFADVVIVLALVFLARALSARGSAATRHVSFWAILLAIDLAAGVILEWLPRAQHRWSYSDRMPTISLAGTAVGLVPIAQVTLLPAASLFLALRIRGRRRKAGE